jgi:site-specific recombinase XerD
VVLFAALHEQPYRGWFEFALKAAKIEDFTWHCLRRTFASRLVKAGVDIRTVAALMGHKTLQMTMRYAHLAPQHLADAVGRLVNFATDTKADTELVNHS